MQTQCWISETLGADELKSFPYILFSTWIQFLGFEKRICRQLVGVPTVAKMVFWFLRGVLGPFSNVSVGTTKIFQMANSNQVDLDYVIPYYSHSDEGRSYKKGSFMDFFPSMVCVGRGTRNYFEGRQTQSPIASQPNGTQFCWDKVGQHNFLFATMPAGKHQTDNPQAMGATS